MATKKVKSAKLPAAKSSVKAAVKKSAVKKPEAKKSAPKAAAVKKPAVKTTAGKKPAATKKADRATAGEGPKAASRRVLKPAKKVKHDIKRVPPRIIRRVVVPVKPPTVDIPEIDTAKAVAFAMSIAQEMKRSAAQADRDRTDCEIKLTRRPTTRAQGEATVKFPESDLKEFRKRLLDARAKALNGVDAMKATGFNESEDREADGGDGTNQTLRLQALGQMGQINRMIQQIEEALHRIDDGTYGVCTVCGQLIRKPRLLNQPFVLTCMECQSEMERNRG